MKTLSHYDAMRALNCTFSRGFNQPFWLFRRNVSKKYSKTLNLPKTSLPLSMKDGATPKREQEIQRVTNFGALYSWQASQNREKTWILHDGPPYANGRPHVGHALNKILKDVVNRYKLLRGYQIDYRPGWDCHGTPIEQKALAELRVDYTQLEPMEIRKKARNFASKTISAQRKEFQRWGVMADWEKGCYFTYDPKFEAQQLEIFYKMYEKGFIYEDFMPVFWSPSSRSALAEAELEYNENHESLSVYMKFPLTRLPHALEAVTGVNKSVPHVVIWTTTPWTLPANQAICYGPNISYSLVSTSRGQLYIVGTECRELLTSILKERLNVLATVTGQELAGAMYCHPLTKEQLPLLPASHVTVAKGTGLVHTAPAHGPEDFQVAVNNNIPVTCLVDESGCYKEAAGPELAGKSVLREGNETVLALLSEQILLEDPLVHSYPYDWRTKQPVILRASKQWFVNTSKVKQRALECLSDVSIYPANSGSGLLSQLDARTYWCISRQRAWGVPVPVFYHQETGQALITRASIDHLKQVVGEKGTDAWWSLPIDQLLTQEIRQKDGFSSSDEFVKGSDVLDIWFDSGTSWASTLNDSLADVYLEGLDQFGGWFQSSLLTSVAVRDKAPYKNLIVHGFTLDESGRKMSKSMGNVVRPSVVIDGGKNREHEPAYGVDVLRWWATRAGLDPKVNIGSNVLQQCSEQVFKVRKSLRYLLGNLKDFSMEEKHVKYEDLLPVDRYMLHLLHDFMEQVYEAYESFLFARVPLIVEKFINTHVSSFYCHTTKDRMYCSGAGSHPRCSGQTVQHHILYGLLQSVAPILPHLTEEVFRHHQQQECDSFFKSSWKSPPVEWHAPELESTFQIVGELREKFFSLVPSENPLEFDLVISAHQKEFHQLKTLHGEEVTSSDSGLAEVLQCSTVSLLSKPPTVIPDEAQQLEVFWKSPDSDGTEKTRMCLLTVLPAEKLLCERCRRYTSEHIDLPCQRCCDVLSEGWDL